MSTDKTLADVQPGGRVRLGDQRSDLVPGIVRCAKCSFQLHHTNLYLQSGTVGAGDSKTEPCPNGCGPLWPVTWETWAREGWAEAERLHLENAALAARQPVGEPVFRERPTHNAYRGSFSGPCRCWADADHAVGNEVMRYAAPPAQAVDLGQFREPIAAWSKHCAHSVKGYESYQDSDLPDWMAERRQQVRKCGELLALIDSHTAGGQP